MNGGAKHLFAGQNMQQGVMKLTQSKSNTHKKKFNFSGTRAVLDPLAMLLLDNRLYLSPDSHMKKFNTQISPLLNFSNKEIHLLHEDLKSLHFSDLLFST